MQLATYNMQYTTCSMQHAACSIVPLHCVSTCTIHRAAQPLPQLDPANAEPRINLGAALLTLAKQSTSATPSATPAGDRRAIIAEAVGTLRRALELAPPGSEQHAMAATDLRSVCGPRASARAAVSH